jgi:hypothetical protein
MFNDKAIAFANNVLIGGPQELLLWAERQHAYENFRPLQLYVTLAEESYKKHLISRQVSISSLFLSEEVGVKLLISRAISNSKSALPSPASPHHLRDMWGSRPLCPPVPACLYIY